MEFSWILIIIIGFFIFFSCLLCILQNQDDNEINSENPYQVESDFVKKFNIITHPIIKITSRNDEPDIPISKLNNNNEDKALETDYYFLKLNNVSNSCYANSTIQALLSMEQPFFDMV